MLRVVSYPGMLKVLDVIRRTLGADDARLEIGGKDPDSPLVLWRNVPDIGRVVAVFREPPPDPESTAKHLAELVSSFRTSLQANVAAVPQPASAELATRRLDVTLLDLAERVSASVVAVVDESSPVIWGRSDGGNDRRIDDLLAAFRLGRADKTSELLSRALEKSRARIQSSNLETSAGHEEDLGYLVRPFAGVYRLLLVFPGAFSELVAEGHALHAASQIERLVLALPPVDPPPGGGKVLRLPTQR
jgi:hypothetical protein